MLLTSETKATPFQPVIRYQVGRTSFIPEQLTHGDLDLMADLAPEVANSIGARSARRPGVA
jgi:hypothetical protein